MRRTLHTNTTTSPDHCTCKNGGLSGNCQAIHSEACSYHGSTRLRPLHPVSGASEKIVRYHNVTFILSIHFYDDIKERVILPPEPIKTYVFDDGFNFNTDNDIGMLRIFLETLYKARPRYEAFISSLSTRGNPESGTAPLPPVDAVFCDVSMSTPIEACHKRGIPVYGFIPISATLFAHQSSVNKDTPALSDDVFYSGGEATNRCDMIAESLKTWQLEFGPAHALATGLLINSFEELEPQAMAMLKAFPQFEKVPMTFVGPLLPLENLKSEDILSQRLQHWMDKQEDRSVVYFSFGTAAVPSAEQLKEIAEALVSLKRPFIWSLRSPQQTLLSEPFIRTTAETMTDTTPYLILPWAPQKQILAHKATGVYVSHCGWNSTLEAVSYGVPVVAWPMFGDQHYNATLIEQCGMGKCMAVAGMKSSTTPASQIAEIIEEVGGCNHEGKPKKPYLGKAQELAASARKACGPDGKSTSNLEKVLQEVAEF
ncbi:uncharacterized protein LOC129589654 [Paramacrobiotus metropolitanus]|uniref:uncharacterized protein LOC129589654 n=1 Tax=Paramacrobiotus metropolitanus TaxID=2943436 RepID=UPI00244650EF|nr:uncharacterized protein LOC129589654 [Paramacrobiotus metropolitanus]